MNVYIKAENFGPIEKAEIDLRPLTVFVGESNTGKTYLAALIYALHQYFEGFSQFPWAGFAATYFTHVCRLLYGQEELEQDVLEVLEKLNTPGRPFKLSDLPQQVHTFLKFKLTDQGNFTNALKRCFDLESVSKLIRFTGIQGKKMQVSLQVCEGDQTWWAFKARDAGADPIVDGHINPDIVLRSVSDEVVSREILDVEDLQNLLFQYAGQISDSYYLPAARSGIMQSHGAIASALIKRATRIGLDHEAFVFSGMIADFLDQIVRYGEHSGSSEEIELIAKRLEDELLGGEIGVDRPTPEAYPEFLYRPEQAEEGLRMSHSSAMISELAPLVLFLRGIVKPGDLLIIEEPEAHLHPGAQTKIAQTLARLVRAGVRVLITTHSDWLLQQIGNLIREGELRKQDESTVGSEDWLEKDEVGAWWFHKDKPVTELPFDLIEGIEPEDYLDIAEDLYNQSAGLQNRIEQTKEGDAVESE